MRNRNEIDRQKDKVYEDPSNHQATFEHEDERDGIIGHRGKGGEIWGKDDRTSEMPWMESVSEQLRDKITNVNKR